MGKGRNKAAEAGLLSLSEVARRTRISMPTLLRYKREHADEIPSVGEGRTQRYPKEAVAVFSRLKEDRMAQRGRRKGKPAGAGKPGKGAALAAGLLSLSEVGRLTGISYPDPVALREAALERDPARGKWPLAPVSSRSGRGLRPSP